MGGWLDRDVLHAKLLSQEGDSIVGETVVIVLPIENDSDETLGEEASTHHPDFEVVNFGVLVQSVKFLLNAENSVLKHVYVDLPFLLFHDVNHLYSFYKIYFL